MVARRGQARRLGRLTAGAALAALLLAACSGDPAPAAPSTSSTPAPGSTTPTPSATTGPSAGPTVVLGALHDVRVDHVVVADLSVPWGVALLPDGDALVAERDTGRILRVTPSGASAVLGTVPGVRHGGEGGLLGLAVDPDAPTRVYAYLTSVRGDNRVVRMAYGPNSLGPPATVFSGIPSGTIHNGGRIAFGPDGNLWIGTGEAGLRDPAQDLGSLGGKILRIRPSGRLPDDNPFPGSAVWSLGHRNVQGLAFDSTGQLWATEFGQDTWDELNEIRKGANYGWPVVEGKAGRPEYVDPLVVWHPENASPSGLAIVDDVAYVATLRGSRLWQVSLAGGARGSRRDLLVDDYGRLRSVVATPDGALWLTTSNRDGRGNPAPSDDRILRLTLEPGAG